MKLSHAASTTLTAIAELRWPIGVGSGALLGVIFGILISSACEPVCSAALAPEKTTTHQRLECVKIPRLNGRVCLLHKISLSSSNPSSETSRAEQHHGTLHGRSLVNAMADNLPLCLCEMRKCGDSLLLGSLGLGFRSLFFQSLTPSGVSINNKPSDNGNADAQTRNGDGYPSWIWWCGWHWYHWVVFFWMCFFSGAGMCAIWRLLMTPNVES